MTSRTKKIIVALIAIVAIIYLLLNVESMYKSYIDAIAKNEAVMRITIMWISSLITASAMIVALFKEDIRGLFVHPMLDISKENSLAETKREVKKNNFEAVDYFYKVFVQNVGNIPATEVEVYLDNMKQKKKDSQSYKEIEVDGVPLMWQKTDLTQIMIPRNSKKSLILFKVLPPDNVSTPDQLPSNTSKQPIIKIGAHEYCIDNELSELIMLYSIYSENAKPINIKLIISWNGKWEARLSEMNLILSIKEEVKNV